VRPPQATTILALCCAASATVAAATAHAGVSVRVRGSAHIEARAIPKPGLVQLRGNLKDDAGTPIRNALVYIALAEAGAGTQRLHPAACAQMPPVRTGDSAVMATTDDLGRFCLNLDPTVAGSVLEVWFSGSDYHDPSERTRLGVDASKRSVELRFSPRPRYLSLDRSAHALHVDPRVQPPDASLEPLELKLLLVPREGEPQQLGSQTVPAGKRGRFQVESTALGRPGPARLTVTFAGSDRLQAAEHSVIIERTARVTLSLAGSVAGSDPSQGIIIPVLAECTLGAVPSGAVEAVHNGQSVGTGRVTDGKARVVALFEAPAGSSAALVLRYLPDAPWWRAGPPLRVGVSVAHPGPWRLWPWALSLLLIAAWVLRGWRRPAQVLRRRAVGSTGPPSGHPSIEVLERGPARDGWHGAVIDAHDGTPVARAAVSLVIPSFVDAAPSRVITDEHGQFTLAAPAQSLEGAQLQASARWYAELTRPLPAPGQLQINLVTRRRALLNRLVDWAERMGYPWRRQADPTPSEVRNVADERGIEKIASWAAAVEQAAYGPDPVDESRESAVRRQEPHWRSRRDTSR
jgi:hypothetical protein